MNLETKSTIKRNTLPNTKKIETFEKNQTDILGLKNTLKEIKNELVNLENTAGQMKKRVHYPIYLEFNTQDI